MYTLFRTARPKNHTLSSGRLNPPPPPQDLNPDFAIKNSIFCSIEDQTNLRLQPERSTSERGSFRLVSRSGLRCLFLLAETAWIPGPVVRSLVSANRWSRGIVTYRFPWYLTLVSANHASSNPGLIVKSKARSRH